MADVQRWYEDDEVTIDAVTALGRFGNNAYVVRPRIGGAAVVVDIPEEFERVLDALGDTPVEAVVVTHHHFDHWGGYDTMRGRLDATVFVGAEEVEIDPARPVTRLAEGETLAVGESELRVLHTPGHTPGSICLVVNGAVLTGDTLFPGGPGRTRSHADLEQEIESIKSKLYVLPEETRVLPGHGDPTTIGESKHEYMSFASREHDPDLHGDVLWLES